MGTRKAQDGTQPAKKERKKTPAIERARKLIDKMDTDDLLALRLAVNDKLNDAKVKAQAVVAALGVVG